MERKRPSRSRVVDALMDHGRRLTASLPPMPDPRVKPREFVQWMEEYAVTSEQYYQRYPDARLLHRRLKHAGGRKTMEGRTEAEKKADEIFKLIDSDLCGQRRPKWKSLAHQLRDHGIDIDANRLRMIVRSRVRTTSGKSADHF